MALEESRCGRCGGRVTAERISAHPSGIIIEFGSCPACGSRLRRILAAGIDAPLEPSVPWTVVPVPRVVPRPRRPRQTRPPRRLGTQRPAR